MRIYILILLGLLFSFARHSHCGLTQTSIITEKQAHGIGGFWKSKIQWKAHWVREWAIKKIYVPIWKKVWTPVDVREWIPIPKHHIK